MTDPYRTPGEVYLEPDPPPPPSRLSMFVFGLGCFICTGILVDVQHSFDVAKMTFMAVEGCLIMLGAVSLGAAFGNSLK